MVFEGVVATIAELGLVLSLCNLVYTWWANRPHVRVTMTAGVVTGPAGVSPAMLIVTVANVGRVRVHLTSAGVDLRTAGDQAS